MSDGALRTSFTLFYATEGMTRLLFGGLRTLFGAFAATFDHSLRMLTPSHHERVLYVPLAPLHARWLRRAHLDDFFRFTHRYLLLQFIHHSFAVRSSCIAHSGSAPRISARACLFQISRPSAVISAAPARARFFGPLRACLCSIYDRTRTRRKRSLSLHAWPLHARWRHFGPPLRYLAANDAAASETVSCQWHHRRLVALRFAHVLCIALERLMLPRMIRSLHTLTVLASATASAHARLRLRPRPSVRACSLPPPPPPQRPCTLASAPAPATAPLSARLRPRPRHSALERSLPPPLPPQRPCTLASAPAPATASAHARPRSRSRLRLRLRLRLRPRHSARARSLPPPPPPPPQRPYALASAPVPAIASVHACLRPRYTCSRSRHRQRPGALASAGARSLSQEHPTSDHSLYRVIFSSPSRPPSASPVPTSAPVHPCPTTAPAHFSFLPCLYFDYVYHMSLYYFLHFSTPLQSTLLVPALSQHALPSRILPPLTDHTRSSYHCSAPHAPALD
ncbi:hypothetical protein C8J57DRAFT_1537781 [Mycena rebaudengoi]|nr:hypothetical protein C8J57DRAFT_1537781 [Mycena rebaudengoi]